jgi:ABC-type glycerol-3-phosphate transport system substrate-binding protein
LKKVFVLCWVLLLVVGCNKKSDKNLKDQTANNQLVITAVRAVREKERAKDDLVATMLKEKFNIVIDRQDISHDNYVNKMTLMFSTNNQPDFIYTVRPEWNLNQWIKAGYLKGLSQQQLEHQIPNFEKLYTAEQWHKVYNSISYIDGKMYYFPGKQSSVINMAWLYRKDVLEQLHMDYPTTTEGMYLTLKSIKNHTGKVPFVAARQLQALWAFSGFMQSFGIPELAIRQLSYEDPFTGNFIPYAFTEQNYRDFLIYMNKLYREGLIWNEFATASDEQLEKFQRQGNGYVMWAYPYKIAEYENISKSTDKNAYWDWSKNMVSADEQKVYFKQNPYFTADGFGFSSTIEDEKFEALASYLNWACSQEGVLFHTFGVEGVTYEWIDNEPVYLDKMTNPNKATGQRMSEYGFFGYSGFIMTHASVNDIYLPVFKQLERTFIARQGYKSFTDPIMSYTKEENNKMSGVQAVINEVRDEYAIRFIMGQIDPSNDGQWQQYINTLNQLGLEEFKKIRISAYNRGKD